MSSKKFGRYRNYHSNNTVLWELLLTFQKSVVPLLSIDINMGGVMLSRNRLDPLWKDQEGLVDQSATLVAMATMAR